VLKFLTRLVFLYLFRVKKMFSFILDLKIMHDQQAGLNGAVIFY